jgi:hypothetical protein
MWIDGQGTTVLPANECQRLMAVAAQDGLIGRLAVSTDQAPVVIPVNFSFRDGRILFRVGPGFLSHTADGHLVAFEVDHVDLVDGSAWSVLVRGLATLIRSPDASEVTAAAHPLVPEPGDMVLVVRPDLVTGRRFALRHEPRAGSGAGSGSPTPSVGSPGVAGSRTNGDLKPAMAGSGPQEAAPPNPRRRIQ